MTKSEEQKYPHLNPSDVTVEAIRHPRKGMQIPEVSSGVRVTHTPTGLSVECNSERAQYQNKSKALQELNAMVYDKAPIKGPAG